VLDQLVAAGMNMVRIGGTMVYENDAFLDACDARGVLLWQDFMFANMDYPDQDASFMAGVTTEAEQLLDRLAGHACLAVLCGNSEGEQQAAMWGAPRERWSHPLFHEVLPRLCAQLAPDVPYWPSSAHGGAFPHQGNVGTTSYYGVGAYLRPITDARRAEIRFATECLGFANVPQEALLDELARLGSLKVHSPLWKSRVPRDLGAGWDFDDVRDHYLREIFDLDPLSLRYAEHDRYLAFSRAVSGEVMAAAFREWRRARSGCNGALIWFLRDLWPGAGWGIVDASGDPKSAWYCLARVLQPRTVFLTDEGGNGLYAHVMNECATELTGVLDIALIHSSGRSTHERRPVSVPARGALELPVAALLEGFTDLSYAYRFGAPPYEAVRAALLDVDGQELAHDFHFLLGHRRMPVSDPGLNAVASILPGGDLSVEVSSERLARFVTLRVPGYRAADLYFHLTADAPRRVLMRRLGPEREIEGEVSALNAPSGRKLTLRA
jgi:beta-mannosidase